MNPTRRRAVRLLCLTLLAAVGASTTAPAAPQDEDLDAFMEKVLERRVTNWEDLYNYTLRDREIIEVKGPGGEIIESQVGEYTWYVRDGYMVRSPHSLNGARVGDAEREAAEERFLDRLRERDERRAERAAEAAEGEPGDGEPIEGEGSEREYFLGFPFEPGNYYVVGFEELEGGEVARIEYYPQELFEDEGDTSEEAEEWTRRFQKTSRVTLWVLVEEHQIVKVAYDNVGLEFLPFRWLVQVDDIRAELTMHKPFPDEDVWLPREVEIVGELSVATGTYSLRYSLEYFDYKETEVGARVRFRLPGVEQQQ